MEKKTFKEELERLRTMYRSLQADNGENAVRWSYYQGKLNALVDVEELIKTEEIELE